MSTVKLATKALLFLVVSAASMVQKSEQSQGLSGKLGTKT